jgi:transposase
MLVARVLAEQIGLMDILDRLWGVPDDPAEVAPADRALVLLANRLTEPRSEHGLAQWLATELACDRRGRRFAPKWKTQRRVKVDWDQLGAWYRTLDRLEKAKGQIELALYERLRDLFSLRPDLVLYDLTSTYFEGSGPAGLAYNGYSRDGRPQNVQVVVGVVMVGGWPIAHHIWSGNTVDVATVQEVVKDLSERFQFGRIVFVGDRGMVSEANLEALRRQGHGYLVGLKRRRNRQVDRWIQQVREDAWVDCPGGINTQESVYPPRTRVQEVASGEEGERVFVIDSEERRAYEEAQRTKSMGRTREKLEAIRKRVESGKLTDPEKVGAAAERALRAHHGCRYYDWRYEQGKFEFFEHPVHLPAELRLEGKYLMATSEPDFTALDAVEYYKQLCDLERGFRHLKDVLDMRPIYHQTARRVRAHIHVAALALLLERLLERRLKEGGVDLSATEAMKAVQTIRTVSFIVGDIRRDGVTPGDQRAQRVLEALGIKRTRPPTPPSGQECVV